MAAIAKQSPSEPPDCSTAWILAQWSCLHAVQGAALGQSLLGLEEQSGLQGLADPQQSAKIFKPLKDPPQGIFI